MSILAKHLAFVNEQGEFHTNAAERFGPKTWRGQRHLDSAQKLLALATDLQAADKQLDAPPPAKGAKKAAGPLQLSLNIEEIADLPAELLQELSISEGDKTEFAILNAIEEAGGVITLDRLLIALYKKTNEIHKRQSLTSRLYRMSVKNLIYNVPGKKGVYSNEPLSDEEVAKLFGTIKDAA
jgi:hypothetical protein